jgi:parvulin-like peptidyl-prolyl isomerase
LAKKHVKMEPKPLPTRRQLSRHRRQQRIQLIIYICGAVFLAIIVGLVGYGYWDVQVKPYRQPVAKINGTTYDMDYYIKTLEVYSSGQDSAQTASIQNNLINIIEYNQAVIKAAPELGISVSSDEINNMLKTAKFPDEKVYRDAATATLLAQKLIADHFDKQIPATVEQANTQALFVESIDIADKLSARLAAGDNFTALANEFSLEPVTKDNGGALGWLPKGYTDMILGNLGKSKLKDIPFTLESGQISQPTFDGMVSKKLGYWVVQVNDKDDTKGKHVRGILASSRQQADTIRSKIVAGDDFATLVKTYSQDTAVSDNVGDMGWTGLGINNRTIAALANPLELGEVSQPGADSTVTTTGGYWLVRVLEKDKNRALDDATRQRLAMGLFENWIGDKMKNDSVETLITEDKKAWALNLVNKNKGQ